MIAQQSAPSTCMVLCGPLNYQGGQYHNAIVLMYCIVLLLGIKAEIQGQDPYALFVKLP